MGFAILQTFIYFQRYPEDRPVLKNAVRLVHSLHTFCDIDVHAGQSHMVRMRRKLSFTDAQPLGFSLFEIVHTALCIAYVYQVTVTGFGREDVLLRIDWCVLRFGIVSV